MYRVAATTGKQQNKAANTHSSSPAGQRTRACKGIKVHKLVFRPTWDLTGTVPLPVENGRSSPPSIGKATRKLTRISSKHP